MLPLAELEGAIREGLTAVSSAAGMIVIAEIMEPADPDRGPEELARPGPGGVVAVALLPAVEAARIRSSVPTS